MADIIKVKPKKTYEWNQDSKYIYVRIPMPSHTSLKKVDIFLSDLILRVTSLEKKSTHFLDLVHPIDYKSSENKFILTDGQIHATLKKSQAVQWENLLIEDISLADLKNRRRESEARYEKNVKQVEETKSKLRQEYDRKATQEMMRFEEQQRKILQEKKKTEKDRAIQEIFSNVNEKTGRFDEKRQKAIPTIIEHQEKKWRQKQEMAMKMIKQEEERQRIQQKDKKKILNEEKIINQVQKNINGEKVSTQPSSSRSMFTQEDVSSYDKLREEVGETQYEEIPIRKANKVEVKFTQRVFPHLAARDTYVKQPPMPKAKNTKSSLDGDVESKNPLWLKDKGDQFLKDKNYISAIQAYTQAINLDGKMLSAWANRSLCHLKIFNFNAVISDCDQCLSIMQGKIGGGQEDNNNAIQMMVKLKTRKAIAKTWRGELIDAKQELTTILKDYTDLSEEIKSQIEVGIQTIARRQESIGYKNKGDEQVKLGNYQKAITHYDQSIGVDKNEYSISNMSLCLNKINKFTQSIEIAGQGIDKISNFNINLHNLSKESLKVTESKKPQALLLKLYYRKAKAFEELSKIKQAEQVIHKALGIDSTDKDFQSLLKQINVKKNRIIVKEEKEKATAFIKQANYSQALKIYSKCLKLMESFDDANQYLGILQNQCVCYLKLNDYESIISTAIRIIKIVNGLQSKIVEFGDKKSSISKEELDKISVRTLMRRANAYLKKDQVYNAKSDLQKALQINPKDETVQKELAKIKDILGI